MLPLPLLVVILAVFCLWTREIMFPTSPKKKDPEGDLAKALTEYLKQNSQNHSNG